MNPFSPKMSLKGGQPHQHAGPGPCGRRGLRAADADAALPAGAHRRAGAAPAHGGPCPGGGPGQAAAEKLLPLLTEEELALYKRGRNAHVHGVPHNAELAEYHSATGLEALFGWLYLQGRLERIDALFAAIMEE